MSDTTDQTTEHDSMHTNESIAVTPERAPATTREDNGEGASSGAAPARVRRRWPWVLGVAVLAGIGVAVVATGTTDTAAADEVTAATATRLTASLQQRDLISTTALSGTLTYADERTVSAGSSGTVTWVPDVGATVAPGEVLYALDGEPVVLLPGDLPMWRDLSERSDDGEDVTVLEQALVTLGITDADTLTVDETFTSVTGDAVADLREAVGLSDGEAVAVGEVVYLPDAVRIAGLGVGVGDTVQPGTAILTATAPERIVAIDLDSADQGLVSEGDVVEVELPDGSTAPGTVTYVSAVAEAQTTTGQNATTTYVIPVEITLASGGDAFDEAPVSITVTSEVATGVLTAPVEALLALAEGGYALEVVGTDGSTSLVAVTVGDYSDGWVEVTGQGIAEGVEVITA